MNTGQPTDVAAHRRMFADDDDLLTSTQTRARIGGVSAMCIWRWMRDDRVRFPPPIQINKRNYWRLGDLRRWQTARAAELNK